MVAQFSYPPRSWLIVAQPPRIPLLSGALAVTGVPGMPPRLISSVPPSRVSEPSATDIPAAPG